MIVARYDNFIYISLLLSFCTLHLHLSLTFLSKERLFVVGYSTVQLNPPISNYVTMELHGDYTVNQCSETTLILHTPLRLLSGDI